MITEGRAVVEGNEDVSNEAFLEDELPKLDVAGPSAVSSSMFSITYGLRDQTEAPANGAICLNHDFQRKRSRIKQFGRLSWA